MLKIREEQMKVFEAAALRSFEDEMAAHARKFSLRLCEILGEKQLHAALRQAMRKASVDYGFTNRGPMRLYIDLMFLFGSRFDTDMVREMARAFPQKAAYVGDSGLAKLIREARTEAKEYGFPTLRGGRIAGDSEIRLWSRLHRRSPLSRDLCDAARRKDRRFRSESQKIGKQGDDMA